MNSSARAALVLAACIFACGCAENGEYMPLRDGLTWTYSHQDATELVSRYRIEGRAPVGSASGYRLISDLGESRLAWSGGTLLASMLGGTVFDPPLPLLRPGAAGEEKQEGRVQAVPWKGRFLHAGAWKTAAGSLTQTRLAKEDRDLRIVPGSARGMRSRMELTTGGKKQVLETTFVARVGIVRQTWEREGRSGKALLMWIAGPN